MENSIGGIHRNYDLLVQHELPVVGEVEVAVDHCLLVRRARESRSSRWCTRIPRRSPSAKSTSRAWPAWRSWRSMTRPAEPRWSPKVSEGTPAPSPLDGRPEVFGLEVVEETIQDYAENITRFVLIGRTPAPRGGDDQDIARVRAAEHARRATQGAQWLCAAGYQSHQARVPPHPRPSLGVRVLRGRRRRSSVTRVRPGHQPPGRVLALGTHARQLSRLDSRTQGSLKI